jgi:Ca2+-binding RTX toxin-like protein
VAEEEDAGEYVLQIIATDEHGAASSTSFALTMESSVENEAPVTADDHFEIDQEPSGDPANPTTIALGNVLANDSDIEFDALSVEPATYVLENDWLLAIDASGNATLSRTLPGASVLAPLGEGESLTFDSDADGNPLFYLVTDGHSWAGANLSFSLLGHNDAPQAFNGSIVVHEDSSRTFSLDQLGWDPDTTDTLRWFFAEGAHGDVEFDEAAGTVTYTPAANYFGPDSFSFVVADQHDAATLGVVDITVKDVPELLVRRGSEGGDSMVGAGLAEILYGLGGNDTINGLDGSDILFGGAGDDVLSGDAGFDTFVFEPDGGIDTVLNFSTDGLSRDRLDISALLVDFDRGSSNIAEFVFLSPSGNDTLLSVDADGPGGAYDPTAVALIGNRQLVLELHGGLLVLD